MLVPTWIRTFVIKEVKLLSLSWYGATNKPLWPAIIDSTLGRTILDGEKKVRIETEVFPKLAEEQQLYGFETHAFWMDIGEPVDYLAANAAVLARQRRVVKPNSVDIDSLANINGPCNFGENVKVGSDSRIGPNVSLADDVMIGKGCRVENSIIYNIIIFI